MTNELTDYEIATARRRMIDTWPLAADLQKQFAEAVKNYVSINDHHHVKDWSIWRWDVDPKWNTHKVMVVDVAEGASVDTLKEILDEYKPLWMDLEIDHFEHGESYRLEDGKPGPEETGEIHNTDMGNAARLVHWHGDKLLYCHPWRRWLVWDGQRWKPDDTASVVRMAKDTVRRIYAEASKIHEKRKRVARAEHAKKSEASARIEAMIKLAQSEPGIPVLPDQLDADPWLLTVANGTLDLRTGGLLSHDPDRFNTKMVEVTYDRGAECPLWKQFLNEIMGGDENMIRFLQRSVGYSLTGDTSERCLFILYGCGANGKTTFLEVIRALLGDYALRIQTETLLTAKRSASAASPDIAGLKGARFASASESEEGRRLAEAFIKDVTGGDTITARFLYSQAFNFKPECKVWLGTNHKPEIRGTDKAIWDRIKLIPFEVVIPEAEQDKHLTDKLIKELPGILAWAVEGCLTWQRDGLGVTEKVKAAVATYRNEMDILGEFIEDCCIEGDDKEALSGDLYAAYKDWGGDLSQRKFGRALRERGYEKGRHSTTRRILWRGIGLCSETLKPSEPKSSKVPSAGDSMGILKEDSAKGYEGYEKDDTVKAAEALGGEVVKVETADGEVNIPF